MAGSIHASTLRQRRDDTQMTTAAIPIESEIGRVDAGESLSLWRHVLGSRRVLIGGGILLGVLAICLITLPLTLNSHGSFYYDGQDRSKLFQPPEWGVRSWFGYDQLGRSILARCLLGGIISLAV